MTARAPACSRCKWRPAIYRVTGKGYDQTACDPCLPAIHAAAPIPRSTRSIGEVTEDPQGSLFELDGEPT
jgi:hypothetical protein